MDLHLNANMSMMNPNIQRRSSSIVSGNMLQIHGLIQDVKQLQLNVKELMDRQRSIDSPHLSRVASMIMAKHREKLGTTSSGTAIFERAMKESREQVPQPKVPAPPQPAGGTAMTLEQQNEFKKQQLLVTALTSRVQVLETKLAEALKQITESDERIAALVVSEEKLTKDLYAAMDQVNDGLSEKIARQRVEVQKLADDTPQPINYDPFNYGEAYSGDLVDFQARKRITELKCMMNTLHQTVEAIKDANAIRSNVDLGYRVVKMEELLQSSGFEKYLKEERDQRKLDKRSSLGLDLQGTSDIDMGGRRLSVGGLPTRRKSIHKESIKPPPSAKTSRSRSDRDPSVLVVSQGSTRDPGKVHLPKLEMFQTDQDQSKWVGANSMMQTMYRLEVELGQLQKVVTSSDTANTERSLEEIKASLNHLKESKMDSKAAATMVENIRKEQMTRRRSSTVNAESEAASEETSDKLRGSVKFLIASMDAMKKRIATLEANESELNAAAGLTGMAQYHREDGSTFVRTLSNQAIGRSRGPSFPHIVTAKSKPPQGIDKQKQRHKMTKSHGTDLFNPKTAASQHPGKGYSPAVAAQNKWQKGDEVGPRDTATSDLPGPGRDAAASTVARHAAADAKWHIEDEDDPRLRNFSQQLEIRKSIAAGAMGTWQGRAGEELEKTQIDQEVFYPKIRHSLTPMMKPIKGTDGRIYVADTEFEPSNWLKELNLKKEERKQYQIQLDHKNRMKMLQLQRGPGKEKMHTTIKHNWQGIRSWSYKSARHPHFPVPELDTRIQPVTKLNEFETIVQHTDNLVVFQFGAQWSPASVEVTPKVEKLVDAHANVFFYSIDGDQNEETVKACNVTQLPTFLYYLNGKLVDRVVGTNIDEVEEGIQRWAVTEVERHSPEATPFFAIGTCSPPPTSPPPMDYELEYERLQSKRHSSAIIIQKHVRGMLARSSLQRLPESANDFDVDMTAAATKIQANVRGMLTRRSLQRSTLHEKMMKERHEAAAKIQRKFRWYLFQKIQKEEQEQEKAAMKIQVAFRGSQAKKDARIMEQKHKAAARIQAGFKGFMVRRILEPLMGVKRKFTQIRSMPDIDLDDILNAHFFRRNQIGLSKKAIASKVSSGNLTRPRKTKSSPGPQSPKSLSSTALARVQSGSKKATPSSSQTTVKKSNSNLGRHKSDPSIFKKAMHIN